MLNYHGLSRAIQIQLASHPCNVMSTKPVIQGFTLETSESSLCYIINPYHVEMILAEMWK